MDWTNELILQFLKLYKSHPCIWNTKVFKSVNNRDKVHAAWVDIRNKMTVPCTVPQLKKKKESLMSAYRAYKTKIKNSATVMSGPVYKPSWFAFATMDSFLSAVYLCNSASNQQSENELIENTDSSRLGTDDTNVSETEEVINPRKAMKRPYSKSHEDHRPEKFQHGDYIIQDGDYKIQDGDSKIQDGDETQVNEECDILTKLWARKLRRLPEDRRDYVIYTINNLIYKECIDSRANASPNRVSPVQMYKEEPFSEENMDSPTNNLDSKELDIALFEESDVFITKMEPQSP